MKLTNVIISNIMQTIDIFKHLILPLKIILFFFLIAGVSQGSHGKEIPEPKGSESTLESKEEGMLNAVPFITLRNKTGSDKAAKFFGDERDTMHAGHCDISRTPLKFLKPLAAKAPFYIPEDILKLEAITELSIEDLWRRMEKTSNGQRPILYSHGFYMDFDRSCKRASMFQKSLGLAGRFLLFSWPSDGAILNYTRDESDLYWSVDPLQAMLTDMISRFGAGNIDIAAHSLGTRGVLLALLRMANTEYANKPLFNQVVLIAPDIDAGIFEQYLPQIQPLVRNITIYVSDNDQPLALSGQVHGYPRLGESGKHLRDLAGVEIIDISDVPVRYLSGHVYHLYHNTVINDLSQLLNEDKPAAQRSDLKQTGENYWRLQPPASD